MREPSLKWVLISIIVGLTVFVLCYSAYSGLLQDNGSVMSSNYSDKYITIQNYQQTYENWGEDFTMDSILKIPGKFLETFLTAVNVGMSVIGNLFTTLTGAKDILRSLQSEFPEFTLIIGLLITIFTIYLVYRLLSEVRGTQPS